MRKCMRVGINVTHKCNCDCKQCFYRWGDAANPGGRNGPDKSLSAVFAEAEDGKRRGCDHVVFVGWGEPTLWPFLTEAVQKIFDMGMTSSIITNGLSGIERYKELKAAGLNHMHVSVHHGFQPDNIMGHKGAGVKQQELFQWLWAEKWPWRANMSIQKGNYTKILSTAVKCMAYGCRHFVSLGFLPLYEWAADQERMRTVVADPKEISPFINDLADYFDNTPGGNFNNTLTIRYHPMCLLRQSAWKYVVNARYVLFDPWEWEYQSAHLNGNELWQRALSFGDSVAIEGKPCSECDLKLHCGGWNRTYYAAYPDCGVHAIKDPEVQQIPGWLHDQNPATKELGFYSRE